MNGLLPVLILALSTIVTVLWIMTRPGADPRQLVRDMVDIPVSALHDLAERADREQLGREAWSTLTKMSRQARGEDRCLRAVRMNPETALAIRLAIGQYDPGYLPVNGGRLYGIDVLVSPAVPRGVIIPVDVGHDRLDSIVAALDTPPRPPGFYIPSALDPKLLHGPVPGEHAGGIFPGGDDDVDPARRPADVANADDHGDGSVGGECEPARD